MPRKQASFAVKLYIPKQPVLVASVTLWKQLKSMRVWVFLLLLPLMNPHSSHITSWSGDFSAIPELRRLRQENCEFGVSLACAIRAWVNPNQKPNQTHLKKTKQNKTKASTKTRNKCRMSGPSKACKVSLFHPRQNWWRKSWSHATPPPVCNLPPGTSAENLEIHSIWQG